MRKKRDENRYLKSYVLFLILRVAENNEIASNKIKRHLGAHSKPPLHAEKSQVSKMSEKMTNMTKILHFSNQVESIQGHFGDVQASNNIKTHHLENNTFLNMLCESPRRSPWLTVFRRLRVQLSQGGGHTKTKTKTKQFLGVSVQN